MLWTDNNSPTRWTVNKAGSGFIYRNIGGANRHSISAKQPEIVPTLGPTHGATNVAVDKARQLWRHNAAFEAEAAQYFLRDGVRDILGSVDIGVKSHHTQRITVPPCHQIGDGGFKVGAIEVGLCERRAPRASTR
jgi:hypothetical protein